MKIINSKELKIIQLSIMDSVASFCEEYEIRYHLAYGTLLGAVRHKGYIPWDDDVDIFMPRPDYEVFMRDYNGYNEYYSVINHQNNDKYSLPYAKVIDNRTSLEMLNYNICDMGVYIDIFPIDGFESKIQIITCLCLNKFLNIKKAKILNNNRTILKNIIIFLCKLIFLVVKKHWIVDKIDKIGKRVSYEKANKVMSVVGCSYGIREAVNKDIFDMYIYMDFEGRKFRVPFKYDYLLKSIYGDYMKLPPIEKQKSMHEFNAIWK